MENNINSDLLNQSPKIEIDNNKSKKNTSPFLSLTFCWIFLTVIYTLITLLGGGAIAALIGLFVPLGIFSIFILFARPFAWIASFIIVLIVVLKVNNLLKKWYASPIVKIIIIFLTLFLLTILVDNILYGGWASLELLNKGGQIKFE